MPTRRSAAGAEADAIEQGATRLRRLALEPALEGQRLAARQAGVEGDVLRQVAEPSPRRELARRGIVAEHPDAARRSAGSGPSMSFISVVLPAPLWPTSAIDLAWRQTEGDVAHRLDRAVALGDVRR